MGKHQVDNDANLILLQRNKLKNANNKMRNWAFIKQHKYKCLPSAKQLLLLLYHYLTNP